MYSPLSILATTSCTTICDIKALVFSSSFLTLGCSCTFTGDGTVKNKEIFRLYGLTSNSVENDVWRIQEAEKDLKNPQ